MKSIAKLVCLSLGFLAGIQLAAGSGNCSDQYLTDLGMIMEEDEEATKAKVFMTSSLLMETGKSMVLKPGAKVEHYRDMLIKNLSDAGLYNGERDCVECFGNSVRCMVKNCKTHCMPDPCKRSCQRCADGNCRKDLLECIGKGNIVNPCTWIEDYENYRTSSGRSFRTSKS